MPLRLKVLAGTTHANLRHISPNDELHPIRIDSDCFRGELRVRIKNFSGAHPPPSAAAPRPRRLANSTYFATNTTCTYSIDFRGQFLVPGITFDDLVFGNIFEKPLRLPPGAGLGLRVVKKFIDPGLEADLWCAEPWARSPVIVTMNAVTVSPLADTAVAGTSAEASQSCKPLVEANTLKRADGTPVGDVAQRKKYYSKAVARQAATYATDCIYGFDFCNGMADFNEFAVRIPGWGYVSVLPLWDGQSLKYVLETKDRRHTVFVVEFQLVDVADTGDEANAGIAQVPAPVAIR